MSDTPREPKKSKFSTDAAAKRRKAAPVPDKQMEEADNLRDKTLVSRGSWLLLLVASRFVLIVDVRERDRRGTGGKQGITIFTDAWVRARWRVKHVVS